MGLFVLLGTIRVHQVLAVNVKKEGVEYFKCPGEKYKKFKVRYDAYRKTLKEAFDAGRISKKEMRDYLQHFTARWKLNTELWEKFTAEF